MSNSNFWLFDGVETSEVSLALVRNLGPLVPKGFLHQRAFSLRRWQLSQLGTITGLYTSNPSIGQIYDCAGLFTNGDDAPSVASSLTPWMFTTLPIASCGMFDSKTFGLFVAPATRKSTSYLMTTSRLMQQQRRLDGDASQGSSEDLLTKDSGQQGCDSDLPGHSETSASGKNFCRLGITLGNTAISAQLGRCSGVTRYLKHTAHPRSQSQCSGGSMQRLGGAIRHGHAASIDFVRSNRTNGRGTIRKEPPRNPRTSVRSMAGRQRGEGMAQGRDNHPA